MKVTAINGSPKAEGNTYHALRQVTDELETCGISTEIVHVGHRDVRGCAACGKCKKTGICVFADDEFNSWCEKLYSSDGVVLGSPVYYSSIAGTMKCFLDRAFYSSLGRMRCKIGASVAVPRRSGGMPAFSQLNNYFLISEMVVAPSCYWNVVHGAAPGEVLRDEEGMAVLSALGRSMAWLLKMKELTKDSLPLPEPVKRPMTNFIR